MHILQDRVLEDRKERTMKIQQAKTTLLFAALLLVVTQTLAVQRVDRTIPADPDGSVSVDNVSGSVEVEGWDRNEVHITGTLDDDVEELEVRGEGRRISISVELPEGRRSWGHRESDADLRIKVPRGTALDVQTVSADVDIRDLSGALDVESVSGDVEIAGEPKEVDVESVSGEILVRGAGSQVEAESVSGSVSIKGAQGYVEASTVSGDLEVSAGMVDRAELESVSGSVTFEGLLSSSARVSAQSHSGTVVLYMPADVSATFEATTFSGSIYNEFGPDARRTSRFTPGQELEFTTGGGGARVRVESFSGSVRLKKAR
jgi:DUF4097 and DUF4098 domain-containing protein YvlB